MARLKCKAITLNGNDCKRAASLGSDYCHTHQGWEEVGGTTPLKKPEDNPEREREDLASTAVTQTIVEAAGQALGSDPEFQRFEIAKRIAHTLAQSNLVPDAYRGRPNDCFVAINMGHEVGLGEFASIQSIAVIDGKPCLYGDGLIGVVRASPKCEWIKETISEDGLAATCETKRKGEPHTITATYSMSDAMQAGIDTKFNWKKHPKRMLQMRARSYCLRDAYPDLLKGLGVVEEMMDHEDTPPPVREYELPDPVVAHTEVLAEAKQKAVIGATEVTNVTLSEVERAIHQSDSMEELLNAGNMAKLLPPEDQGVARITYKRMRKVLMEGLANEVRGDTP